MTKKLLANVSKKWLDNKDMVYISLVTVAKGRDEVF